MNVTAGLCASCANLDTCNDKLNLVNCCSHYRAAPPKPDPQEKLAELQDMHTKLLKAHAILQSEYEAYKEANPPKRKPGRPRKSE